MEYRIDGATRAIVSESEFVSVGDQVVGKGIDLSEHRLLSFVFKRGQSHC